MEDDMEGADEWMLGIISDLEPDNCEIESIDDIFNIKEGNFGCSYHENSKFNTEKIISKGGDDDDDDLLNSSMDVDGSGVLKNGLSIAERRAIKCGFNASAISTPWFRCSSLLPGLRDSYSPYVSVSPGISPQALLDSPIMLPNSQLSPTTGSFVSHPRDGDGQMSISAPRLVTGEESDGGSSVLFKSRSETSSLAGSGDADNQFCEQLGMDNRDAGSPHDRKISCDLIVNSDSSHSQPRDSTMAPCHQTSYENGVSVGDNSGSHNSTDGKQIGIHPQSGTVRTADDGYNWRKYGQKQVKGSEYPRSYYKCTHPNCQVKKKVEHSHGDQVTEIIYKGAHNHPKPQPSRKSGSVSLSPFNESSDVGDGGSLVWRITQPGYTVSDWRIDGLERTSSTGQTEVSDPLSSNQGKQLGVLESAGTPEFSSTMASNEDEEEDAATLGKFGIAPGSGNEPDSKRRKKDDCFPETTFNSRPGREPRVVIQIESEIDVLDDGYRWRKYGQKVVKGNPNPRSYYKCTSTGCIVRKHVERSSQSKKFIITTYEGKHNHEVPTARNSSHGNSGSRSFLTAATSTQPDSSTPRSSHLPNPEPHSRDLPLHINTQMECNNGFSRANFICNVGSGTPNCYPMKFPALPNSTPYGCYNHQPGYVSSMVPTMPDLSFSLPLGLARSISGYCVPERSHSSVQSLYGRQDVELLKPKQEGSDDSYFENEFHAIEHTNSSLGHNQVMGNFQP